MGTDEQVIGAVDPLFAIRRGLARPRFLAAARQERCRCRGSHTRIVSTGATPQGVVERIAGCRCCFEAACGVVRPTAGEQADRERIRRAVAPHAPVAWFDGTRLAAEERERRGMLSFWAFRLPKAVGAARNAASYFSGVCLPRSISSRTR